jgi:hypothetical protein
VPHVAYREIAVKYIILPSVKLHALREDRAFADSSRAVVTRQRLKKMGSSAKRKKEKKKDFQVR